MHPTLHRAYSESTISLVWGWGKHYTDPHPPEKSESEYSMNAKHRRKVRHYHDLKRIKQLREVHAYRTDILIQATLQFEMERNALEWFCYIYGKSVSYRTYDAAYRAYRNAVADESVSHSMLTNALQLVQERAA